MILNSPYISGSLTVTGNTTIQGQLTVTGSLSGTASLASNALLLQGTGSTGFATTSSLLEVSSSQQQISSSQQQISASFLTLTASYAALSSSYISLSASYNTFSGSASTRTTQIEQVYATTGSNSFRANQSITGSLVVSSTITAQTLVVQTVTSSIVYSSGSNIFGCDLNSRQTFTGSVLITGSLTIAGASSATSYSGTTIFGSTIACSPIGCFATSCATSFIGGTMSGATIYGSTAVCSAVGKFTTCIDAGSGMFSGNVVLGTTALSGGGAAQWITTNGTAYGGGLISSVSGVIKAYYYYDNSGYAFVQGASGVGVNLVVSGSTNALTIASTGIACFACQVCAPNLLISNCATIGTVGFSYPEFRLAVTPIMTVVGAGCTPTSEGIYFKRTSNLCQGGWISGNGGALYLVGQNKHATAFGNIYFSSNNGTTTCDIMVIDGVNQRVGIGTTTPSYKLDIAGTAYVNGSFLADSMRTLEGSVSNPYNVWTTMFTVSTNTVAIYYVIAVSQGNGLTYTTSAMVVVNDGGVGLHNYVPAGALTLQTSGYDVQVKNGSGSTMVIRYKFIKMA